MMRWNKLAIELIALDEWTKSTCNLIYGAVTTGEDWRFGIYNRTNRQILQIRKLADVFFIYVVIFTISPISLR
ncbi:MAG: hypothetical protein HEQ33_12910 [Dolichospermum sp. WA123]|nr:hypothetical protein [Dolichospermum sp. WA123]